jgi:hypothetical protein
MALQSDLQRGRADDGSLNLMALLSARPLMDGLGVVCPGMVSEILPAPFSWRGSVAGRSTRSLFDLTVGHGWRPPRRYGLLGVFDLRLSVTGSMGALGLKLGLCLINFHSLGSAP